MVLGFILLLLFRFEWIHLSQLLAALLTELPFRGLELLLQTDDRFLTS